MRSGRVDTRSTSAKLAKGVSVVGNLIAFLAVLAAFAAIPAAIIYVVLHFIAKYW